MPHRNHFYDISEPNLTGMAVCTASTHHLACGRRPCVCVSPHAYCEHVQCISPSAHASDSYSSSSSSPCPWRWSRPQCRLACRCACLARNLPLPNHMAPDGGGVFQYYRMFPGTHTRSGLRGWCSSCPPTKPSSLWTRAAMCAFRSGRASCSALSWACTPRFSTYVYSGELSPRSSNEPPNETLGFAVRDGLPKLAGSRSISESLQDRPTLWLLTASLRRSLWLRPLELVRSAWCLSVAWRLSL